MKHYYWKSVLDELLAKWKLVLVFAVILAGMAAVPGYKRADVTGSLSAEEKADIKEYEEQLETYTNQIKEIENSIEQTEKEAESMQQYVDNALYMKINSQSIPVVNMQYAVTDTMNTGNVLSGFVLWCANGSLQEALEASYDETQAGYIREMISWETNGNMLSIKVYHPDESGAKQAAQIVKEALEAYKPVIEKVQGEFTLKEVKTSSYVQADMNVANNQNAKYDSLKSYMATLADYNGRLATYRMNKSDYEKNHKPEVMEAAAPGKKIIVIYAVFGALLAVVLWFVWYTLRYILSDRIRSAKELGCTDVPVFCRISQKEAENLETVSEAVKKCAIDAKLLAEEKKNASLCISLLSEDKTTADVTGQLIKALEEQQIGTTCYGAGADDAAALHSMIQAKQCIIVVKAGTDTYPQLAERIQLCRKYRSDVWGCVVVE